MGNTSDKRKFNRSSIDFILAVYAEDGEGKRFEDKADLSDVSGEGAKFLTQKYDKYFLGQVLDLTIFLPGTQEMEAYMTVKAIVVRIDPPNSSAKDPERKGRGVAVQFETHLNFETTAV